MDWATHPASPLLWQNCIFAAMIFLSMLYFTVSILGGMFEADVGDDVDAGDADVGGEGDGVTADSDAADGDADGGEADADEPDAHTSFSSIVVGVLNTENRCPLTLALSSLMLIWGVAGYIINVFLLGWIPWNLGISLGFGLSFVASGAFAVACVRKIAPLLARAMPSGKTSVTAYDLIGRHACPSTLLAPGEKGFVEIEGEMGVITKLAVLKAYEGPPLRRSDRLLVQDYDHEKELYVVVPLTLP